MPTARERSVDPGIEFVAGDAEVGRTERHVGADRGHEQLIVGVLEDDADAPADLAEVRLGHGQPADVDSAALGSVDAVEVQDQGGLAGAIRAEYGNAFATVDREVDAVERDMPVGIREGDVGEVNCRCTHRAVQAHRASSVAANAGSRQVNHRAGSSSPAKEGIEPVYPRDSIAR